METSEYPPGHYTHGCILAGGAYHSAKRNQVLELNIHSQEKTHLPGLFGDVHVDLPIAEPPAAVRRVVRVEKFGVGVDEVEPSGGDDVLVEVSVEVTDPGGEELVQLVNPGGIGKNEKNMPLSWGNYFKGFF